MHKNEIYGDRTMSTSRIALLTLFLCTFALAAQAAGKPQAASLRANLRDAVVVDSARGIAYVTHPQGGVQAVDLARGTSLWRSTQGERPLSLVDNLLIAQAQPGEGGELRVVALDVRKRGALSAEADLAMPESVRAEVHDTLRQAFRVVAAPSPEGIVVSWEAEVYPSLPGRGEREVEESERAEEKSARVREQVLEGTALFNPSAGHLLSTKAAGRSMQPVFASSLSAPGSREARFSSADGRHVLASVRTGNDTSAAPYRWTVSDRGTGAVLGSFPAEVSMSPFVVVGKRLIHVVQPGLRAEGGKLIEQPLRLRAVDLTTGRELWTREILDTEFRGAIPN
jgi:hypothetical protein